MVMVKPEKSGFFFLQKGFQEIQRRIAKFRSTIAGFRVAIARFKRDIFTFIPTLRSLPTLNHDFFVQKTIFLLQIVSSTYT
jgi:hypothetical protein